VNKRVTQHGKRAIKERRLVTNKSVTAQYMKPSFM
jgi:hypothetical protein